MPVTVTLSFAGGGVGTVVVNGTTCTAPTSCQVTVNNGSAITLTAKPANGSTVANVFSGWSGACATTGTYRFCDLTITADTSVTATFNLLTANLVFVTSQTYVGNLGSAMMYQNNCNALATAAGINNSTGNAYIAWMGASNYAPVTLLGSTNGWVRADLQPWIGTLSSTLTTGNTFYPVALDENGKRVHSYTLTGLTQAGTFSSGYNCSDWSSESGTRPNGNTHAGGRGWVSNDSGLGPCSSTDTFDMPVVCMENSGMTRPVSVSPATGKKIYLTKTAWAPGGGVGSADSKCLADAPAGVTAVKAVLRASTRAFSDVLAPSTSYVRPDGVLAGTGADIASAMSTTFGPATLEGSIIQDGGGTYVGGDPAWTGADGTNTCSDWSSAASTVSGRTGHPTGGWVGAGDNGSRTCNTTTALLYCAEQ